MSFLSVDVGSSRCKAALFSENGVMLALRSAAHTPRHPQPGYAELDPDLFLRVVAELARELTALPECGPLQSVCLSSHGETLIPAGADDRPLCPAILNTDTRAAEEAAWCEQQLGRERLFSITGHISHPMYPLPRMVWLRRHAPDIFRACRHFYGVTDYLLLQLGLPPLLDYSHASRFMAFDVHRLAWSEEVLSLAEVAPQALSRAVPAGTIAGRLGNEAAALLGVPQGTPVIVGGHDQVIGAVGLGVVTAGRAAGSLGTYECLLVASTQPQLNPTALETSLNSYPHAVPGLWANIAYFPSGIMLDWLNGVLFGGEAGACEETRWQSLEAAAPADPTGLLVTPHLIGTCNPEFNAHARAAVAGIGPDTSRASLYKGVLEGIAAELTSITGYLESAGCSFDDVYVAGGGTHSALGMRLRAALTGKSLHIMECQESVCLGGAMLSSVALGIDADLSSAAQHMVREQQRIVPDAALARQYAPQLAAWRRFRSQIVPQQIHSTEGEPS
ncbi:MAG: FGGY-family carbohydrate kinase [Acidobacteriaceae bacterium]